MDTQRNAATGVQLHRLPSHVSLLFSMLYKGTSSNLLKKPKQNRGKIVSDALEKILEDSRDWGRRVFVCSPSNIVKGDPSGHVGRNSLIERRNLGVDISEEFCD